MIKILIRLLTWVGITYVIYSHGIEGWELFVTILQIFSVALVAGIILFFIE